MDIHCHVEPVDKTPTVEELSAQSEVVLVVYGMGCPRCEQRVRNSLLLMNGVVDALVDHLAGMAKIVFNPQMTTIKDILDAVERAGNDGRHTYCAVQLC
jgi:copper chaperone CopZ